ncbi:ATP-dependent nuclease [Allosphingosinicella humi]
MRLVQIVIENFRGFGEGDAALHVTLPAGIATFVGENDSGKTAIMDALRLVLGTRGQEYFRVIEADFHQPPGRGETRREIRIMLRFEDLSTGDCASFLEFLTYEDGKATLILHWRAVVGYRGPARRFTTVELKSGATGDGPVLDAAARALLYATYLRPLRDADQALSAGRGSRLAQILQQTALVTEHGDPFDPDAPPADPTSLSVLGIGDFANHLLEGQGGVTSARDRLNSEYLAKLSFAGDALRGKISVGGARGDDAVRLRQLLEKLELELRDDDVADPPPSRGLGSNNLLFMASELLLLAQEHEGFPALLIEEPEAHLHPQRQIRLVEFLKEKAALDAKGASALQVLMTTHSPTFAASLPLKSLILVRGGKAFPLGPEHTLLDTSDYAFLERFLDATKANLFFARGVLIVEGDGEAILLPTLARLIDRDLAAHGVSIVNVGGTGLGRYARIFQRRHPGDGIIDLPVACIADMDVMPDCAPAMLGLLREDGTPPPRRNWRTLGDFDAEGLVTRRSEIQARANGQNVRTFVADHWTLEYDLAAAGLGKETWQAASLAAADARIHRRTVSRASVLMAAARDYDELGKLNEPERATGIYSLFHDGASKAIAAQYLAAILDRAAQRGRLTPADARARLPRYLVEAIDHVTGNAAPNPRDAGPPPVGLSAGASDTFGDDEGVRPE